LLCYRVHRAAALQRLIPKARLDQQISKTKSLEEALEKARAENEALKSRSTVNPVAEQPRTVDDLQRLREDVAAIKRTTFRAELKQALNLATDEQIDAVEKVMQEAPALKVAEAAMLATTRNAELFGGKDPRAFDPGQHGSLRPRGAGPPPPKSLKDRAKEVDAIADPVVRAREVQRLFGKELAKMAGIPRND
jgi:hypothetical protein